MSESRDQGRSGADGPQAQSEQLTPRAGELLADLASAPVCSVAASLELLQTQTVTGALGGGAVVAADVSSLSRLRHVLDYETARRVRAAEAQDVLPNHASTVLAQQGWSAREARQTTAAAAFADTWPQVAALWQRGVIGVEVVATLARATRPLTREQTEELLHTLIPRLQHLTAADVRRVVRHAIELLRPDTGSDKEQADYDRRHLAWTTHQGVTSITGELPALEGAAFTAAITALVEALRVAGDGLTRGQRQADALAALVARAAAKGQLPTAAGLPAAASIVIGASEADRIATGTPRGRHDTLLDAANTCSGARQGAIGTSTTLGDAAARFLLCAADLTGVLTVPAGSHTSDHTHCLGRAAQTDAASGREEGNAPIATALGLQHLEVLALGRKYRTATAGQRKALAIRDVTCFTDGCSILATECQPHHVRDWAAGGNTDLDNLTSACWSHHRQLDLGRITVTRNPDPTGPRWIGTPLPRSQWPRGSRSSVKRQSIVTG